MNPYTFYALSDELEKISKASALDAAADKAIGYIATNHPGVLDLGTKAFNSVAGATLKHGARAMKFQKEHPKTVTGLKYGLPAAGALAVGHKLRQHMKNKKKE